MNEMDESARLVDWAATIISTVEPLEDLESPEYSIITTAAGRNAFVIESQIYEVYTKPNDRNAYVMVGNDELCFHDRTYYDTVATYIWKRVKEQTNG